MGENYSFGSRLIHAWNAFWVRDPPVYHGGEVSYGYRPDRVRFTRGNERTIVTSVINRIGIDCAAIKMVHARMDENDRFLKEIDSGLNNCLTVEANIDQTGRAFIQDMVMSLMDEGCIAIVPVDTTSSPLMSNGYDIQSLRVGKVIEWYPDKVRIRLYNDKTGRQEEVVLPKSMVGIVENPLFAVMNEPNSTMQRLIRKLALLDVVDEQTSSGKLDLIIQLPYVIKTEARRKQADERRKLIEDQLAGSKYGIAYTDGTERITQLNRSLDNNLMKQIEYLQNLLWSQLGITQAVMDGTADDKTMLNYHNRTIEPIVSAIVLEMRRKFLTKTARSQHQSIVFFNDPFKLVPVAQLADVADKFRRNEILSSNELRQIVGYRPNEDPKSDALTNPNISQSKEQIANSKPIVPKEENQNGKA